MFFWNYSDARRNPTSSPFRMLHFVTLDEFINAMDKFREEYGAQEWKALGQMRGQIAVKDVSNKEDVPIGLLRNLSENTLQISFNNYHELKDHISEAKKLNVLDKIYIVKFYDWGFYINQK